MTITDATPDVIKQYLAAADAKDSRAVSECFAPVGTVTDEGKTYTGRTEIRAWRDATISQWTYTTTLTGAEAVSSQNYEVSAVIEGDFPGGRAELTFAFTIEDGLIAALHIG